MNEREKERQRDRERGALKRGASIVKFQHAVTTEIIANHTHGVRTRVA